MPDARDELILAIARSFPGWNDDTSEPDQQEPLRSALEAHWKKVNRICTEQATALVDIVIREGWQKPEDAPLDPEPWVARPMDSDPVRFATEDDVWGGYRAHFEPRTELGYTDQRGRYHA